MLHRKPVKLNSNTLYMPLSDNGFLWRPNDNSAKTNLRYTLEAEKWVNAVSSAQRKAQPRSISGDLAFIGMVFELVLSVSLLILLGLLQLIKALVQLIETGIQNHKTKVKDQVDKGNESEHQHTPESQYNFERKPDAVWNFKKEKRYPEGWQLIFYTEYGYLRWFWQFLILLVFIFIVEIVALGILSHYFPAHIRVNDETMIFAGLVSLYFALTGAGD